MELESTDTFRTPTELATKVPDATIQMLEQAREAVRGIETRRKQLTYYASVLWKLKNEYPEAVSRLSIEDQALVAELAERSVFDIQKSPAEDNEL